MKVARLAAALIGSAPSKKPASRSKGETPADINIRGLFSLQTPVEGAQSEAVHTARDAPAGRTRSAHGITKPRKQWEAATIVSKAPDPITKPVPAKVQKVVQTTPKENPSPSKSKQNKARPNTLAPEKQREAERLAEKLIESLSHSYTFAPTRVELIEAQAKDEFAGAMRGYLENGALPVDQALARKVLLYQDQFVMGRGVLLRISPGEFAYRKNLESAGSNTTGMGIKSYRTIP